MWKIIENEPSEVWDERLATFGGHPLQSALWGDARAKAEGNPHERLLVEHDGRTVLQARIEARHHKLAGKIAWIPQGPLYLYSEIAFAAHLQLKAALKARGYQVYFEDPRDPIPPRYREHGVCIGGPSQTIIVDLSVGPEALWRELSANWRNEIRGALKKGICVREVDDDESISRFVAVCAALGKTKGFRFQGSAELVSHLLRERNSPQVTAKLYAASLAGEFLGGLFVFIVGASMQNIWNVVVRSGGGSNRLLQWTAMKAASDAKVTRYDLGGIDPIVNPGVYKFKRALTGPVVTFPPIRGAALSLRGGIALAAARALRKV